jgi:hypothetical protein
LKNKAIFSFLGLATGLQALWLLGFAPVKPGSG